MDGISTDAARFAARNTQRLSANREELLERIARAVPEDGAAEPLRGLHLFRVSAPFGQVHSVAEPSFCVIAQGSKEVLVGSSRYRYDPEHYLITTVELPRISQILEASPEQPYLSLRMDLDPALVSAVILEMGNPAPCSQSDVSALDVSPLDVDLQDAVLRLVRLAEFGHAEARVLAPLVTREIIYRLLAGRQSARLCHLASVKGDTSFVAQAVERLRQNFDQPLRMADLARELGVSISGLHHHFKAVTAMSPLRFQKNLRLQEARRLMLNGDFDAAGAAFRVGYNDASHFNREYKSLFGVPPMRDVQRLRGENIEIGA